MKPIIEINQLYKKYRIGVNQPYYTLRESLTDLIKKPFNLIHTDTQNRLSREEFWALNDISFTVERGEVLGIIGRNGAGKSTLLKLLSRITPPTRGEIVLRGRVASLLEIGTGFHQELTGRENIFLNGSILGLTQKEIKSKFDEIVDFAEIEKFLDTPVKFYSSGMYMRLAFAVAAHLDSEILLVDEVLAVGDAAFQKKCLGKMENVAKEGRTVLFISHNTLAIRTLCQRTILLDKGEIISNDTTEKTLGVFNKILREIKIDDNTAIRDKTMRRGTGDIRFHEVKIQDIKGNNRTSFTMGENIRFVLSYMIKNRMKGLAVYIALRSNITREIITSVRQVISEDIVNSNTKGTVIVELPNISIRPGEYPLYLQIGSIDPKVQCFDVLDDLTAPLIITCRENTEYADFDSLKPIGYFSIPSKLIIN